MLLPLAWHLGFRGFMSLCFSCVLVIGASRICFSPDTWFDGSTFKRLKGVLVLHGCCVSLDMASASPWIERLASSIFLVAALECPEHLQFAGHCWHKLSVAFAGLRVLECPEHLQFAGHCWHKLSVAFAGLVSLGSLVQLPQLQVRWSSRF